MTFVVGTALREKGSGEDFIAWWPVVFENEVTGLSTQPVGRKSSRETAQQLADELNVVLAGMS
jgi:hypothetical protein